MTQSQTNEELKPCPFCGENPNIQWFPDPHFIGENFYNIECQKCFSSTFNYIKSEEEVIKRWNKRVPIK